jgi:hypothetical protein
MMTASSSSGCRQENDADICNIVMHHLNRPLEDEEDEPEDSSQAVSETSEGAVPDKLEAPSYVNNTYIGLSLAPSFF